MKLVNYLLMRFMWDATGIASLSLMKRWWGDERGREVIRARATTGLVLTFPEDEVKVIPSASLGGWLLHKIRSNKIRSIWRVEECRWFIERTEMDYFSISFTQHRGKIPPAAPAGAGIWPCRGANNYSACLYSLAAFTGCRALPSSAILRMDISKMPASCLVLLYSKY